MTTCNTVSTETVPIHYRCQFGATLPNEHPEITARIWKRLFTLSESDVLDLYRMNYERYWEIFSELEKPDWWTGNLADDERHNWYWMPIFRFVDQGNLKTTIASQR